MKKLIFIGGPMGVGKTTICKKIQTKLKNCVYLDGDWCWFTNPWILNEETRKIVILNAAYMLKQFIESKSYDTILFSWILHEDSIVEDIINRLPMKEVEFYHFSLIATEAELMHRLEIDINNQIRTPIVLARSKERLKHYPNVHSKKIDTTGKNIEEVSTTVLQEIEKGGTSLWIK